MSEKLAENNIGSVPNIIIDTEFKNLIPPLSVEEYKFLEQSIIIEKRAREPLILWAGENILLDGHNRHDICIAHKLPFKTMLMEFPDEDAAKAWVIGNQLGRRNLKPDQFTMFLGQKYNFEKRNAADNLNKGDKLPKVQNDLSEKFPAYPNISGESSGVSGSSRNVKQKRASKTTAAKIATQHGISESTVKRAGKLAAAVENLTKKIDSNFKDKMLAGEGLARDIIIKASDAADQNPGLARKILESPELAGKRVRIASEMNINQYELICTVCQDADIRLQRAVKQTDLSSASEEDYKFMNNALAGLIQKVQIIIHTLEKTYLDSVKK